MTSVNCRKSIVSRGWLAAAVLGTALAAATPVRSQIALPLAVDDRLALDGTIVVATDEWKLVFDAAANGGIAAWYDRVHDPGETDNLATASFGGAYTQGAVFDYDVYLGTSGMNQIEFSTALGRNADPGALELAVIERTPARVRIRQHNHPRLNNGSGPPEDPFPELKQVRATTLWTIYPTGKVQVHFEAVLDPTQAVVDSGPGGIGRGVSTPGCCGFERWVNAGNGVDFHRVGVWAGDTIESPSGGWGPIRVAARFSPTQLVLDAPVPAGTDQGFVIRRPTIWNETISIHADGDPAIANQCADPATSTWEGGSNGDPVWDVIAGGDPCQTRFRAGAGHPPITDDVVLAHWTRTRGAGSLLAFFAPWAGVQYGAFNDRGFTDISYTQLGIAGTRPFAPHQRDFVAQLGTVGGAVLPRIKSVADALPFSDDFRTPFAEARVGALASGAAGYGFDPASGTYGLYADGVAAAIAFDTLGAGRTTSSCLSCPEPAIYLAPALSLQNFDVDHDGVIVELSTDDGATFAPLAPETYNLTGVADEAALGADRRLFQYLASVPATSTGAGRWVFRFRAGTPPCVPTGRDADEDGIDDACDVCPADPDPLQADADGDGTGDRCDLCPAAANHPRATLHKATLSRLLPPAGDDRLNGLEARDLTTGAIAPHVPGTGEEVEIRLADRDGVILRETIAHPASDDSWRSTASGTTSVWRFRTRSPARFGGITHLDLREKAGVATLRMNARDRDLGGANADHLALDLRIGSGATADCWSALAATCEPKSGGQTLRCR